MLSEKQVKEKNDPVVSILLFRLANMHFSNTEK